MPLATGMIGYKSPYSVTILQRSMRLMFPVSLIEKTADGTLGPNPARLCSSLAFSSVSSDWVVPECRAPPAFQSCSWQSLLSHLFWSPSLSQPVCVSLPFPSPCTTLLCVSNKDTCIGLQVTWGRQYYYLNIPILIINCIAVRIS